MYKILKKKIYLYIEQYAFSPRLIGIFFNPFWLCRSALYNALTTPAADIQGDILDFGCGTTPYRALFTSARSYTGLEHDTYTARKRGYADIFYDGSHIPLENASIDCILSTQTLEHVINPAIIISEWSRILRQGGSLILTVPFIWPEHEMPSDYQRYTTNGIRILLEKNNFTILQQQRLLCDCRTPAQLFLAWLYDTLRLGRRSAFMQLLLTVVLFAPITILSIMFAKILSKQNINTYIDNFIIARKVA
jgi:SAM-dependent methyltransferase